LSAALRFPEAEAVIDQALAQQPTPYLYRAKASYLTMFHGDLDGAAAMISKVPGPYLLEDSGAFWASQIWMWRREPEKSLTVWRAVTHDLIECSEFRGPKAFFTGQAHHLAGRSAAAQTEWTAALRIVEQQLAAQPSAPHWIYWRARVLASLERRAEAEETLKTFEELAGAKGLINDTIPIYLLLGRRTEVLDALEKSHDALVTRGNPALVAQLENNLRFNPEWDLLREEPRFAAMLKKPDAKK
jgi:tetratricopeptide (TPR) repeat protein